MTRAKPAISIAAAKAVWEEAYAAQKAAWINLDMAWEAYHAAAKVTWDARQTLANHGADKATITPAKDAYRTARANEKTAWAVVRNSERELAKAKAATGKAFDVHQVTYWKGPLALAEAEK